MKNLINSLFTMVITLFLAVGVMAQSNVVQYDRPTGFDGVNVFEASKLQMSNSMD